MLQVMMINAYTNGEEQIDRDWETKATVSLGNFFDSTN